MMQIYSSLNKTILHCMLCGNNWPHERKKYEAVLLRCDCEVTALIQDGKKTEYSLPVEKFYSGIKDKRINNQDMGKKMKLKLKELLQSKGVTVESVVEKYNEITGENITVDKFYRWGRGTQIMELYEVNALAKSLGCLDYVDIVDREAHLKEREGIINDRLGLKKIKPRKAPKEMTIISTLSHQAKEDANKRLGL